jgi:magnesium-transporting ATPase (P-type)
VKYSAVSLSAPRATVLIKGAPEKLLPFVRYTYDAAGRVLPFSPFAPTFSRMLGSHAEAGERVLLVCEGEGMPLNGNFGELTLICAVSLRDPIRREAAKAVRELQGAGVQIVMITGDNRDTAAHIAAQCGIRTPSRSLILTGEELGSSFYTLILYKRNFNNSLVSVSIGYDVLTAVCGIAVNTDPTVEVDISTGNGGLALMLNVGVAVRCGLCSNFLCKSIH